MATLQPAASPAASPPAGWAAQGPLAVGGNALPAPWTPSRGSSSGGGGDGAAGNVLGLLLLLAIAGLAVYSFIAVLRVNSQTAANKEAIQKLQARVDALPAVPGETPTTPGETPSPRALLLPVPVTLVVPQHAPQQALPQNRKGTSYTFTMPAEWATQLDNEMQYALRLSWAVQGDQALPALRRTLQLAFTDGTKRYVAYAAEDSRSQRGARNTGQREAARDTQLQLRAKLVDARSDTTDFTMVAPHYRQNGNDAKLGWQYRVYANGDDAGLFQFAAGATAYAEDVVVPLDPGKILRTVTLLLSMANADTFPSREARLTVSHFPFSQ